MHREHMIASDTFTLLFAVGLGLALLAILVSLIAFVRLWQTGFRGWGHTFQALLGGLVLIAPLGIAVYWADIYPRANDVATSGPLPELILDENKSDTPLAAKERAEAFPTAVARTYALPPDRVLALVAALVSDRQWDTRLRREPVAPSTPGRMNALAMTLFGYRDEVGFLVSWTAEGSIVSMRSASLYGLSDLGANGRRIEAFLAALDKATLEAQRQGPIRDAPTPDAAPEDEQANGDAAATAGN